MAITFTRGTNRVNVDINSGEQKTSLDPNLQVSGLTNGDFVFFSVGPLDQHRKELVARYPVLDISGRPNNNAADVADWLSTNFFYGNDYTAGGPGTSGATEAKQDSMISELQDIELDLETISNKMVSSDVSEDFDAKEIVRYTSGALDGKIDYIVYKTGGRFGTEVARRTLYYDGNNKLQYIEKT